MESSGSTRSQTEDERLEAEREPTPCTVVFRTERKTQPVSLGVPLGWPQRSGGQAPEATLYPLSYRRADRDDTC